MNKYQEAMNYLWNAYDENKIYGIASRGYLEWLQELVDKETPKKPIDIEFGPCGDLMLCCPTCKHGVVPIPTYHGNKYYPRCTFCGQKLMEEDKDDC
jgi:hypothetical protein